MRNTRINILEAPGDITTRNNKEILISQNPGLNLPIGDIKPKFIYVTENTLGK